METQFGGPELVRRALPPRREDGHKGTFGKVLIVGGAVGYTGAPYLAASAAVRTGCGLVSVGVPESIWPIEAVKCSSAMPFPLPVAVIEPVLLTVAPLACKAEPEPLKVRVPLLFAVPPFSASIR